MKKTPRKVKKYRRPTTSKQFKLPGAKSASQKGYDKHWRIYRFRYLHHNPKCYACGRKATVVDHIVAHKGDEELFKNLTNHAPLCNSCHNYVTGKFDRHNPPLTEEKFKWFQDIRKRNNIKVRITPLDKYIK